MKEKSVVVLLMCIFLVMMFTTIQAQDEDFKHDILPGILRQIGSTANDSVVEFRLASRIQIINPVSILAGISEMTFYIEGTMLSKNPTHIQIELSGTLGDMRITSAPGVGTLASLDNGSDRSLYANLYRGREMMHMLNIIPIEDMLPGNIVEMGLDDIDILGLFSSLDWYLENLDGIADYFNNELNLIDVSDEITQCGITRVINMNDGRDDISLWVVKLEEDWQLCQMMINKPGQSSTFITLKDIDNSELTDSDFNFDPKELKVTYDTLRRRINENTRVVVEKNAPVAAHLALSDSEVYSDRAIVINASGLNIQDMRSNSVQYKLHDESIWREVPDEEKWFEFVPDSYVGYLNARFFPESSGTYDFRVTFAPNGEDTDWLMLENISINVLQPTEVTKLVYYTENIQAEVEKSVGQIGPMSEKINKIEVHLDAELAIEGIAAKLIPSTGKAVDLELISSDDGIYICNIDGALIDNDDYIIAVEIYEDDTLTGKPLSSTGFTFIHDTKPPEVMLQEPKAVGEVASIDIIRVAITDGNGSGINWTETKLDLFYNQAAVEGVLTNDGGLLQFTAASDWIWKNGDYKAKVTAIDNLGHISKLEFNFMLKSPGKMEIVSLEPVDPIKVPKIGDNYYTKESEFDLEIGIEYTSTGELDLPVAILDPDSDSVPLVVESGIQVGDKTVFTCKVALIDKQGSHEVKIASTDNIGNQDEDVFKFVYDNEPPKLDGVTVSLKSELEIASRNDILVVTIDASSEPFYWSEASLILLSVKGGQLSISLDVDMPNEQNQVETEISLANYSLPDGLAKIAVEVSIHDEIGNKSAAVLSNSLSADTTPPLVSAVVIDGIFLDKAGNNEIGESPDSIEVAFNDPDARLDPDGTGIIQVIEGEFIEIATKISENTITLSDLLTNGVYELSIIGVDALGNVSPSAEIFAIEIASPLPEVSAVRMYEKELDVNSVTLINVAVDAIEIDFTEPGAEVSYTETSVTVLRDGIAVAVLWNSELGKWLPATALDDGEYTLEIIAADILGNIAEKIETFEFIVDIVAPQITAVNITLQEPDGLSGWIKDGSKIGIELVTEEEQFDWKSIILLGYSETNELLTLASLNIPSDSANSSSILLLYPIEIPEEWQFVEIEVVITNVAGIEGSSKSSPIQVDGNGPEILVEYIPPLQDEFTAELDSIIVISVDDGSGPQIPEAVLIGEQSLAYLGRFDNRYEYEVPENLADGEYMIEISSTDVIGNSWIPVDYKFKIDTTFPVVETVTVAGMQLSVDTNIITHNVDSIELAFNDGDGSGVDSENTEINLFNDNGEPIELEWATANQWQLAKPIADGAYRIEVTPVDKIGNKPGSPQIFDFVANIVIPQIYEVKATLQAPDGLAGWIRNGSKLHIDLTINEVQFNWKSVTLFGYDENGRKTLGSVSLNIPSGSANKKSISLMDLAQILTTWQSVEVEVVIADNTGAEAVGISSQIQVDRDEPEISVEYFPSLQDGYTAKLDFIAVIVMDEGSGSQRPESVRVGNRNLTYSGQSGNIYEYEAPSNLSDGEYIIEISVSDIVGNFWSPTENEKPKFTFDATPPNVVSASIDGTQLAIEANVITEEIDSIEIAFDDGNGSGFAPSNTDVNLLRDDGRVIRLRWTTANKWEPSGSVADGEYTLQIMPADKVRNKSDNPQAFEFLLDTTSPQIDEIEVTLQKPDGMQDWIRDSSKIQINLATEEDEFNWKSIMLLGYDKNDRELGNAVSLDIPSNTKNDKSISLKDPVDNLGRWSSVKIEVVIADNADNESNGVLSQTLNVDNNTPEVKLYNLDDPRIVGAVDAIEIKITDDEGSGINWETTEQELDLYYNNRKIRDAEKRIDESKGILTFTIPEEWETEDGDYIVKGEVEDIVGNSEDVELLVEQIPYLKIISTLPEDGAMDFPISQDISVTFSAPIKLENLRIVINEEAVDAARISSSAEDEEIYTVNIGYDLETGVFYTVRIEEVESIYGAGFGPEEDVEWTFTAGEIGDIISNLLLYPNPFALDSIDNMNVKYNLQEDATVTIWLFNMAGRLVWRQESSELAGANKQQEWDGTDIEGMPVRFGTYIFHIQAEKESEIHSLSRTFLVTYD